MIKVYGITGCPDCEHIKPQLDNRFTYIEINNVNVLHEFLDLRDHRKEFDDKKAIGKIGIPCFLCEDNRISFQPEDFGLTSYSGPRVCDIHHKGSC